MKWFSSKLILILIAAISLWIASNIHWGKDNWKGILESDAKGYYAYLPAFFIYQDPNFEFFETIEEKYPQPLLYYDYRKNLEEGLVNKYYIGSAVLQTPFFLLAHGLTSISDAENADGYSKWYQIAVSLSSLFYLWFGLFYLRLSLKHIGLQDYWISITLLCTLFSSNLFVYAITDPGYSHIYSFALISFFLFQCLKFSDSGSSNQIYWIALSFGLIVLIRPINFMVIFALPFIFGSKKQLVLFLNRLINPKILLVSILLVIAALSIQFCYYKLAINNWWVYSYEDEGFNFRDPHFWDILFSYKKGLFLYTPIYLLSFLGLIRLWREDPFRFWSWIVFFTLITYVFSSWWMWFYGASFSSRVYIEYLPLFMMLFGFYLRQIQQSYIKGSISLIILALIVICQIQIYQYRHYIIHYSEMTKEKYWEVFLRL